MSATPGAADAQGAGREAVGREWLIPYGLLYTGQNLAWAGPVQVLIALQVLTFRPEDKETAFALARLGGSPGLYLASGGLVLLGSLAILPVRSVR